MWCRPGTLLIFRSSTPPTAVAGARSLVLCNGRPGGTGSNGRAEDEKAGGQVAAWSLSSLGPQGAFLDSCLGRRFLCMPALGIHFQVCALSTHTCWGQVRSLLKCLFPFPLYLSNMREVPTLPPTPTPTSTPTANPTQPKQMLLRGPETCYNDLCLHR